MKICAWGGQGLISDGSKFCSKGFYVGTGGTLAWAGSPTKKQKEEGH